MKKYLILLLTCLSFNTVQAASEEAPHKTIYLITPSRSLSTVFTRMMSERGDFDVYSEPAQRAFMNKYWPKSNSLFNESSPVDFEALKALLMQGKESRNIFAKEMGYAVKDFLREDPSILKDPNVHVAFLVRKPHSVTLSRYFRNKDLVSTIEQLDRTRLVMGFEGVYEVLKLAKQYSPNPVTIILSEDLADHPEQVLHQFCDRVGIPFLKESLQWEDGGDNFQGATAWHEAKTPENMYHWHGHAINSTGFGKPTEYELDAKGVPTFGEVEDAGNRERLRGVYLENLFFYEKFLEEIPEGALVSTSA
tara:strand:+ start:27738 stop:28658 length:921 start_codon:yes stop_codon:yes gene_type:complete